jgi:triosephosphate isomerase
LLKVISHPQALESNTPRTIKVGAQSVYFEAKGAYTAAISAPMLKSVGTEMVLVGHSERRSVFGESDSDVNKSLKQVLAHDMVPILCVGETLSEYESGDQA